ncbi:hypothetical protein V1512DRAFT_226651 [Lipomyces arxii]|uniref:uncharacterized protein n=1 Tax=Lipomyces arxii TaxID=56418 RepID=UPI0034CFE3E6
MTIIPIIVRHSGKKYTVDLNTDESGEVFKFQLYSLTGVDPDRQKILIKGGQLRDDTDLNSLGLKPNQVLMMLGTAGELPKEPVTKMTFIEDMTDKQLAETTKTPNGILNLGNTCYLNSTLQCLRIMPELASQLNEFQRPPRQQFSQTADPVAVTESLSELYQSINSQTTTFNPNKFLMFFRIAFPQFAQRGEEGYKQQDAEEAFSQILNAVDISMKSVNPSVPSFVQKYMTGTYTTTMTCAESDIEPVVHSTDNFLKLDCHITGQTNFLHQGLLASLSETIEKHSDVLGRNAQFTLKKQISRLPKYLTVHFMRFYWRRDTNMKAKILRKVAFPFELDVTDMCEPEYKSRLVTVRDKVREVRKLKQDKARAANRARTQLDSAKDDSSSSTEIARLQAEAVAAVSPAELADNGACVTGLYELIGVLSHKGKSADSGHYQFWSKQAESDVETGPGPQAAVGTTTQVQEPKWWQFNDDKVTLVDQTKIEAMAGGGESDSALILLYRAIPL